MRLRFCESGIIPSVWNACARRHSANRALFSGVTSVRRGSVWRLGGFREVLFCGVVLGCVSSSGLLPSVFAVWAFLPASLRC